MMIKANKLLARCLGLGLVSCVGVAQAADDAVLFKIHDIVANKNADGLVVSCDLGATFYNRTDSEIANAAVRLIWKDDVVADAIEREQREAAEASRLSRRSSRYNTSTYNKDNVTLNLKLPPIKARQQVTLKSKITSDRCYLLLNDMEVEVTNCGMKTEAAAKGKAMAAVNARSGACNNLFRFVSVKNPEYYTSFQDITYEEQAEQKRSLYEQQVQEIDKAYNEASDAVASLTNNLNK